MASKTHSVLFNVFFKLRPYIYHLCIIGLLLCSHPLYAASTNTRVKSTLKRHFKRQLPSGLKSWIGKHTRIGKHGASLLIQRIPKNLAEHPEHQTYFDQQMSTSGQDHTRVLPEVRNSKIKARSQHLLGALEALFGIIIRSNLITLIGVYSVSTADEIKERAVNKEHLLFQAEEAALHATLREKPNILHAIYTAASPHDKKALEAVVQHLFDGDFKEKW